MVRLKGSCEKPTGSEPCGFQFLMVRLKVGANATLGTDCIFQFLMVRLKEYVIIL